MEKNRRESQKRADKAYEEKRAGQRTRNWTVIFYPEDLPENWTSLVDELHFKWVQSPIHDKDLSADGKPKKPHYHTLFIFENVKTYEQIESMLKEVFGESETGSIIGVAPPTQVVDRCAIVRYMAHMDNPDKVQYDVAEITGHNGADVAEILKYSATETREMIVAMEEYIEENGITELADFSKAIRYDRPEWHTLLATKMTMYFNAFIRSCRHRLGQNLTKVVIVDSDGVIVED
jgi:hypothetical protein